jgi:hypothetical protein
MGTMTKLRLGGLVIIGLVLLGVVLHSFLLGEGRVHVMFPADDIGVLKVDGVELPADRPSHRARTFFVKQGMHQISVERPSGLRASYSLNVEDGFAFMVVPVDDQQCFALIDVTKSHYGDGKGPNKVLRRFTAHAPTTVPSSTYFGEESLPASIKDISSVYMLHDIPCSMAGLADAQLLAALEG